MRGSEIHAFWDNLYEPGRTEMWIEQDQQSRWSLSGQSGEGVFKPAELSVRIAFSLEADQD